MLDAALAVTDSGNESADATLNEMRGELAALRSGVRLPLLQLRAAYDLDDFEYQTLLLAASVDIDVRFKRYFNGRPSVDAAVHLLCPDPETVLERYRTFLPSSPLFRNLLLRFADDVRDADPPVCARLLRIEDRVLGHILGDDGPDVRLNSFVALHEPAPAVPSRPEILAAAERIGGAGSVLLFTGPDNAAQTGAALAIADAARRRLLIVDLAAAACAGLAPREFANLCLRECLLLRSALFLDNAAGYPNYLEQALPILARLETQLIAQAPAQWRPPNMRFLAFTFEPPSEERRGDLWRTALFSNGHRPDPSVDIDFLAAKFSLDSGGIAAAVHHAGTLSDARDSDDPGVLRGSDLHAGARAVSPPLLNRLARRVESAEGWDDLVLPQRALAQLREISAAVDHRLTVYARWGFRRKLGLGSGYKALFSGPSGAGKTMAAGVLARGWGLDLYTVDLAAVVSKYIGETEKNLDRLFDEVRLANAVLFFDEADALFGKRSEVKDAHDRYANLETAFLLQKIDVHDGIVFLATNLSRNLDAAFARRLHANVEFPLPDAALRERIWRNVFPAEAPIAGDTDLAFCARNFELSGGNIRNIAVAAAFLAAEQHQSIGMKQIIVAAAREMQKLGALPSRSAFGDYYDFIHGA
jgi:hypothetical protein